MTRVGRTRPLEEMTGLVSLVDLNTSPHPESAYAQLRAQWGEVAPVELEPGVPAWLVMGYHENIQVSRDERQFSRSSNNWKLAQRLLRPDSTLVALLTPVPHAYHADGERHRRLRAPLDDGVAALDPRETSRATQAICLELIEKFAERREADLIADYAVYVPALAVAGWFGLGTDDGHRLLAAVTMSFSSGKESQEGFAAVHEILTGLMAARREKPADDLMTLFVNHPNLQDDSEIIHAVLVMILSGYEATIAWIGQTLRLMLSDPRFGGRVRGGRLDLADALDEVLWRRAPIGNMACKYALNDTELGGQWIRRGDMLVLSLAAANADPRVHGEDPWLEIGNRAHLSWGAGPHSCPAHDPGRVITRVAVETVLTRLHDVKLTIPADEVTIRPAMWTTVPAGLPVRFTKYL